MSNVKLQDNLGFWYNFNTEYWDDQKNRIEDRSGYGRNGIAVGGPTVSVPGPAGFDAASFDGSSHFESPGPILEDDEAYTMAVMVKVDDQTRTDTIMAQHSEGSAGTRIKQGSEGDFGFIHYTESGDVRNNFIDGASEVDFRLVIIRWDGEDEITSFVDGEVENVKTGVSTYLAETNQPVWVGGNDAQNLRELHGDIAFAAIWTRALSDREVQYLSSISGPRRATL